MPSEDDYSSNGEESLKRNKLDEAPPDNRIIRCRLDCCQGHLAVALPETSERHAQDVDASSPMARPSKGGS